jgi:hypothetical protein
MRLPYVRLDRVDVVVVLAFLVFVVVRGLVPAIASADHASAALLAGSIAVTVLAMVLPSRRQRTTGVK